MPLSDFFDAANNLINVPVAARILPEGALAAFEPRNWNSNTPLLFYRNKICILTPTHREGGKGPAFKACMYARSIEERIENCPLKGVDCPLLMDTEAALIAIASRAGVTSEVILKPEKIMKSWLTGGYVADEKEYPEPKPGVRALFALFALDYLANGKSVAQIVSRPKVLDIIGETWKNPDAADILKVQDKDLLLTMVGDVMENKLNFVINIDSLNRTPDDILNIWRNQKPTGELFARIVYPMIPTLLF
jgi:hypothetical protein